MSAESPPPSEGASDRPRRLLGELRLGLLRLHKALIDYERIGYEGVFGKVELKGEFLQLLIHDPWFAWLHPLSELVVLIDETLDGEEPVKPEIAKRLMDQARRLLKPSETGDAFAQHYFNALQQDPDVVMTHADVSKLFSLPD